MPFARAACLTLVVLSGLAFAPAKALAEAAPAAARVERDIAVDDVKPHVEFLASPRMAGRSGDTARVAADYIRRHFEKLGLDPLFGESWYQNIPAPRTEDDGSGVMGRNVGAWLPGRDPARRDEFIIV